MEMLGKILLAGLMIAFIVMMWRPARDAMENGPKAQKGDWMAVAIPIVAVVGFVILLIMMV